MSKASNDRLYVLDTLWQELNERWDGWEMEYQQQRDLGLRGEFVGLYRKCRKLKTLIWDGADERMFREGVRTILFEVIAHAFLMLVDYDRERADRTVDVIIQTQRDLQAAREKQLIHEYVMRLDGPHEDCGYRFASGSVCGLDKQDPIHLKTEWTP